MLVVRCGGNLSNIQKKEKGKCVLENQRKNGKGGKKGKTRTPSAGRAVLRDRHFINTSAHAPNTDIASL